MRVYRDGKVNVGTASKGQPFERWSLNLTSYDDNRGDYGPLKRVEILVNAPPPLGSKAARASGATCYGVPYSKKIVGPPSSDDADPWTTRSSVILQWST